MAALSNPKVMAALQGMMSGGAPDMAKMQELMSDPEVGPAMQKLMEKMGPMMGGMGGMGGTVVSKTAKNRGRWGYQCLPCCVELRY